jgi:hypothetical protein
MARDYPMTGSTRRSSRYALSHGRRQNRARRIAIEDYCRACKTDRMHTVIAADPPGQPLRVSWVLPGEHNYRGGPSRAAAPPTSTGRVQSSGAHSTARGVRRTTRFRSSANVNGGHRRSLVSRTRLSIRTAAAADSRKGNGLRRRAG